MGVPSFESVIPILKKGIQERLSEFHDLRVAKAVAGSPPPTPSTTKMEMVRTAKLYHQARLYASVDSRGLQKFNNSPSTLSWVNDGSRFMHGHAFVTAIKLRLGLIHTKMRTARNRPAASVICDVGCGRPEPSAHILQVFHRLVPERTKRHDNVLTLLVTQLTKKGYTVLREPTIRTSAGVRKPDIVVFNDTYCGILDVQMVAGSSAGPNMLRAYDLKTLYYDREEIKSWVWERSGLSPLIFTCTINCRGLMPTPAFNALRLLGINK